MNRLHRCIYVLCLFGAILSSNTKAIEKPNIDLYKVTLNGRPMQKLTLDAITDILGRPSNEFTGENFKNLRAIYYSSLWLAFAADSSKEIYCAAIWISGNNQEYHGFCLDGFDN